MFTGTFRGITYYLYGVQGAYDLTDRLSVSLGLDAQHYCRTVGQVHMEGEDVSVDFGDGAGIELQTWMLGLSLGYRF